MKLIYSPPSPFARKVLVLAHEADLIRDLELVPVAVLPTKRDTVAHTHNPLGKVPTLVLADGESIFDSRVISEVLNSRTRTRSFIPQGEARWKALTESALADGIIEAALSIRYETAVRPKEVQWAEWVAGQRLKISQALPWMEEKLSFDEAAFDLSHIGTACALGYLDFRLPDMEWRKTCPRLSEFFEQFGKRLSMIQTAPN